MLVSVHLRGNNLNIHNTQTNSSCREIKMAFKSLSRRLREISEEHVHQHKYKQEQHDSSTCVLGISVLICKNSFTCKSSVYSRRIFSTYTTIIFWHYLEVLDLKTTVFNNLGLEKTCAHTLKSKVCHTDYNLTPLSCHE
jgi:hypothetical protein